MSEIIKVGHLSLYKGENYVIIHDTRDKKLEIVDVVDELLTKGYSIVSVISTLRDNQIHLVKN